MCRLAFLKNKKWSGTSLPVSCSALFLKKNVSHVMFYYQTKFHSLFAFTSWDIGKYVYCNCLLTKLWRHTFRNYPYLSNQAVFPRWPKNQVKMMKYLENKKNFQNEIKSIFNHFKSALTLQISEKTSWINKVLTKFIFW